MKEFKEAEALTSLQSQVNSREGISWPQLRLRGSEGWGLSCLWEDLERGQLGTEEGPWAERGQARRGSSSL